MMLNNIINKIKIFLGIGIDVTPPSVPEVHVTVNTQITDAVTQVPAKKPRKSTKKAG
jgi:hypothetical protein